MKPTWDMPVEDFVPSDQSRFLVEEVTRVRWVLKFLKRRMIMVVLGQAKKTLKFEEIPESAKRILWINLAAPSLGDALMDTSARGYLNGRHVDLLTHQKNIELFQEDPWFSRVTADVSLAGAWAITQPYDLVICDSFSPRVMRIKTRVTPKVPFVGLYGFLNGFEVHRIYFAHARMKFLTQAWTLRPQVQVRNYFSPPPVSKLEGATRFSLPKKYYCLVIGGEWEFRTYQHWAQVLEGLGQELRAHCVLIGGANGKEDASKIVKMFPEISDVVGQTSLAEVAHVLRGSSGIVCSDGGLWHMATGLNLPSVVLFANCDLFDAEGSRILRQTHEMDCLTFYDGHAVSNIHPSDIIESASVKIKEWLSEETP